jgi:solute carrier family 36 (proton-coupled amino acid transporter)
LGNRVKVDARGRFRTASELSEPSGAFFAAMTSPSIPVNIRPRPQSTDLNADSSSLQPGSFVNGSPGIRALRAQYSGTPPRGLEIPPRNVPTRSATPVVGSVPAGDASPARIPSNPPPSGSPANLPLDLDDLPPEEKARILQRHLVSKEERERELREQQGESSSNLNLGVNDTSLSRRSSGSNPPMLTRQDTEAFPIHYDAPGADVTCVILPLLLPDPYRD